MNFKRMTASLTVLAALAGTGGCGRTVAAQRPEPHPIEGSVDISFFTEEKVPEPEPELPADPLYDTVIGAKNGSALAELKSGKWERTELGNKFPQLVDGITDDAVAGPGISYELTLDTDKSVRILDLLRNYTRNDGSGIEGCAIVTLPDGTVESIVNSAPDIPADTPEEDMKKAIRSLDYFSTPQLVGSTAKILVSGAMLCTGAEQYYSDTGSIHVYDRTFQNWDSDQSGYGYGIDRNLFGTSDGGVYTSFGAFAFSSNTYFMNALRTMGYDTFAPVYNKYFGFNSDGNQLKGYTLTTDWDKIVQPDLSMLRPREDDSEETLGVRDRQTAMFAIGMCNSDGIDERVSLMYMNAVTGAVASGQMHSPRINSATDVQTVPGTEPLPEEVKSGMWSLMYEDAVYSNCGPAENYDFYIKTGSASTWFEDDGELKPLECLTITGFIARDSEPLKVITLFIHNGADFAEYYTDDNGETQYSIYASSFVPLYREIAGIAAE
ncbi:MAG TPA: hypothetical protein DCZ71_06965 [Ruminococcus sp.]|nr:hypothetical protein [Ruminococcus sp.]